MQRSIKAFWLDIAILCGCILLFSWLALVYGRDVPWDYFNYHAYAAHILSQDRLNQDFFAAGLQGYLNPIGFIPLALTQHFQFGSMSTAIVLAGLHSLNAFFLYLICRQLCTGKVLSVKLAMGLGWILGVSTPVFLIHLGSTFVDPIASSLLMASAWLAISQSGYWKVFLACALAGIATAIKLSSIAFALAIAVIIAYPRGESPREWLARSCSGAAGMLVGFCIFQGYWSWRLWETMGNPFFPLFNHVFQSPYFITDDMGTLRFMPMSLGDIILLPYRILLSESWVYLEIAAPTIVPLLVCISALAVAARAFICRKEKYNNPKNKADVLLCVLVLTAAVFWLATSTNGRYGITLFMLLGPTLAALLLAVLPVRYAILALAIATALQIYTFGYSGITRWASSGWTPKLMTVDMPEPLRQHPQLFISISSPSHSEIVPYLHPDSVYVNLRGAHSLPSSGPTHGRVQSLIAAHKGRVQILLSIPRLDGLEPNKPALINYGSALVDREGLRILEDHCQEIRIDQQPSLRTRFNDKLQDPSPIILMSCSAVQAAPDQDMAKRRSYAAEIMDAFEKKCPTLFFPKNPQIEGIGESWLRKYFNRDGIGLSVRFDKDIISYGLSGQTSSTYIGKVSEWKKAVGIFECKLPGNGKRSISFFNAYEEDSIWY